MILILSRRLPLIFLDTAAEQPNSPNRQVPTHNRLPPRPFLYSRVDLRIGMSQETGEEEEEKGEKRKE
jgi:hypothetical protein